jgi:hypothetical protein
VNKTIGRGETSQHGHGDYGSGCVPLDNMLVAMCY